jgi:5-methylcytosine-specific restriction endonuclease McrA
VPKRDTKHRFRRVIIDAWDGCCAYCGCRPEKITLDHLSPKCKGGKTTKGNLVPACIRCNGAKNHHEMAEWFRSVPWHCPERELKIQAWIQECEPIPCDGQYDGWSD